MPHTDAFACTPAMVSRYWSILILVFLLGAARAQTNSGAAALKGTVVDGTGALLPGARIALFTVDGREITRRTTDAMGVFAFSGLQPGSYRLVVEKEGFRDVAQSVK